MENKSQQREIYPNLPKQEVINLAQKLTWKAHIKAIKEYLNSKMYLG